MGMSYLSSWEYLSNLNVDMFRIFWENEVYVFLKIKKSYLGIVAQANGYLAILDPSSEVITSRFGAIVEFA